MKRLYVGCRVRVVYLRAGPKVYEGMEGRILAVGEFAAGSEFAGYFHRNYGNYRVEFADGMVGQFITDQLEPIQDPGHQAVEWSECLWQPEGITA